MTVFSGINFAVALCALAVVVRFALRTAFVSQLERQTCLSAALGGYGLAARNAIDLAEAAPEARDVAAIVVTARPPPGAQPSREALGRIHDMPFGIGQPGPRLRSPRADERLVGTVRVEAFDRRATSELDGADWNGDRSSKR